MCSYRYSLYVCIEIISNWTNLNFRLFVNCYTRDYFTPAEPTSCRLQPTAGENLEIGIPATVGEQQKQRFDPHQKVYCIINTYIYSNYTYWWYHTLHTAKYHTVFIRNPPITYSTVRTKLSIRLVDLVIGVVQFGYGGSRGTYTFSQPEP